MSRPSSPLAAAFSTRLAALLVAVIATALVSAAPAGAQAPERVVALTPFTANTLAQVGKLPVGRGQTLGGNDRIEPALRRVPVLPLSHPNGPNVEQLAGLRPQLILSTTTWTRGKPGMEALGATIEEVDPTSAAAVPQATRRIGELVGRQRQADTFASRQQRDIAAATERGRRGPTVLAILGVGRAPFAMLANSWGGDVVERAGGRLLTQGLRAEGGYARISDEIVVERNPDVIIAVPHGNPGDIPAQARFLRSNPAWRTTNAARNGRIYVSTGNSLLQPFTDAARTIRDVRSKYLAEPPR